MFTYTAFILFMYKQINSIYTNILDKKDIQSLAAI